LTSISFDRINVNSILQGDKFLKKLIALLVTIAVFGLFQHAQAASFDCKKAGNKIERTICQDPEISMLDEELSKAYKVLRAKEKEVVKEQRAWLKIRNKCGDTACLKKIYSERVAELVSRGAIGKTSAENKLNEPDLRRARSAGSCIAWAEQGNRILRELGKSSNMNRLIDEARNSVKTIKNQAAVNAEIQGWRTIVQKNLQEVAKGDLKTEQVLAIGFLKECVKEFSK
jgi:uncharacterized protein